MIFGAPAFRAPPEQERVIMKVCVVGGTGNISEGIVRLLLDMGHEVACFNRGRRGGMPDGARLIAGDRLDRDGFEKTI